MTGRHASGETAITDSAIETIVKLEEVERNLTSELSDPVLACNIDDCTLAAARLAKLQRSRQNLSSIHVASRGSIERSTWRRSAER